MWGATSSSGSQVGLCKRLGNRLVGVLLAVNQGLILDTGDHAHIDGCGAEPGRLIADIEHRCRSAIFWRQPHQILAPCPADIYDMVRGTDLAADGWAGVGAGAAPAAGAGADAAGGDGADGAAACGGCVCAQ